MRKPEHRWSGDRRPATRRTCGDREGPPSADPAPAAFPAACHRTRTIAARLQGPGFATRRALADYLRVSARDVAALVAPLGLRPNRVGRYSWDDIWERLWGIRGVPPARFDGMRSPLLTGADLAGRLGVSERSIRRDGDRARPRHGLPRHLDLAARIRRHHPLRIHAFERGLEPEPWLEPPAPVRSRLGLVARRAPTANSGHISRLPTE